MTPRTLLDTGLSFLSPNGFLRSNNVFLKRPQRVTHRLAARGRAGEGEGGNYDRVNWAGKLISLIASVPSLRQRFHPLLSTELLQLFRLSVAKHQ